MTQIVTISYDTTLPSSLGRAYSLTVSHTDEPAGPGRDYPVRNNIAKWEFHCAGEGEVVETILRALRAVPHFTVVRVERAREVYYKIGLPGARGVFQFEHAEEILARRTPHGTYLSEHIAA